MHVELAKLGYCDKIPEGCTQCKRAKRTCPGYRPAGDRIFRDESSRVAQKIKAKEDRKRSSNSPTSQGSLSGADNADRLSDAESSIEIVRQDRSSLSVSFSLAPNLEDRALAFFVYNYAIGPNEPSKGNFDRIPDLYQRPNLDETLLAAMTAVGIATYSHAERAPSLINNARYQYIKAIQFTNAALRNPEDAKKDSTLMAIQVLGIFETVTGCQQRSLKDWMEHIYGAAAVIKLRGHQQTRTPAGRRMLIQVASSLLINCVHRAIRVPEHIRDYMEEAMRQSTTPAPGSKILQIMMLLADLRASIREGSVKGPRAILGSALELDGFLLEISANVPPGWEYATITTNIDSNFIYNGRYHVYHAYWIALMWNVFRTIRIILNDIIRGALLDGFSIKPPIFTDLKYATQLQVATETLYDMQADILATVPQFIGGINLTRTVGKDPLKDPIIAKFTPVPMSGCSFLIWPLWLAGVMDNTTDAVRNFVSRVLRSIGDNQGIRQAHILADLVERNSGIQVWNDENHDRV
ncbi:hypothetical protein FQN54_009539 [Arachnomyces sp. PD_36]|nr:hypothetical protein FQN54_009539 [Arachnomyces sp. PD_36]